MGLKAQLKHFSQLACMRTTTVVVVLEEASWTLVVSELPEPDYQQICLFVTPC